MSYLREPQAPPSWTPVVLVGALATFLTFPLVGALMAIPGVGPLACCCMPLFPAVVGAGLATFAARRDPWLGPGQGFAVTFIAAGIGSVALAVLMVLAGGGDPESTRRTMEEMNRGLPPEQRLGPEAIDQMVEASKFAPACLALGITFVAGFAGMVTAWALRSRRRVDPDEFSQQ